MALGGTARTVRHQILSLLGLGEGDDITNTFLARKDGDQAVKPEGNSAMGRGAVFEGFKHIPEPGIYDISGNFQYLLKNLLLHIGLVDPDTSAPEFHSVEHDIVVLTAYFFGLGFEQGEGLPPPVR